VVQFARGVRDGREYAVKFFLDIESFYAEAALYVAAFPHLKEWLSERATTAMAPLLPPEHAGRGAAAVAVEVQLERAAESRFLPQVRPSCTRLACSLH
jgi:hypothetical protein